MIADTTLNPAAVELGIFYRQPPQTVWRALTDPDWLQTWLLLRPTGFRAAAGTRFQFTGADSLVGRISCEVLVAQTFEQLTYSWEYPQADYPGRWVVDWVLQPHGRGTRLLLTQSGFDIEDRRQRMMRNAVERSWKRTVLPRLAMVVEHLPEQG